METEELRQHLNTQGQMLAQVLQILTTKQPKQNKRKNKQINIKQKNI